MGSREEGSKGGRETGSEAGEVNLVGVGGRGTSRGGAVGREKGGGQSCSVCATLATASLSFRPHDSQFPWRWLASGSRGPDPAQYWGLLRLAPPSRGPHSGRADPASTVGRPRATACPCAPVSLHSTPRQVTPSLPSLPLVSSPSALCLCLAWAAPTLVGAVVGNSLLGSETPHSLLHIHFLLMLKCSIPNHIEQHLLCAHKLSLGPLAETFLKWRPHGSGQT